MRFVARTRMLFASALMVLLTLPTMAFAAGEDFDPSDEFRLDQYIPLEFGPIDLSVNKAVIYMAMSSAIIIGLGLFVVRRGLDLRPKGAQNVFEMAYDFTEKQIAGPTMGPKVYAKYFPYVATLFLFILVNNLISFIPWPFAPHGGTFGPIPDLGLYAATANINVTLALALATFMLTHYEGVRAHGPVGYLKTMNPEAPGFIRPVIFSIELLSQLLRLVSLSVRLFANLMAGHLLIIMAAAFSLLLGSYAGALGIPFGVFFWVFEWLLVAGLQAFIFAMLSALYIGYAVESSH
ncbi:MAG: F0F1 ATP synthase subunit A [Miltoncostaeaceae bacterium]